VDRLGSLKEGDVIELGHYRDVSPDYLQEHVDSIFSNGFSQHGERYLLKGDGTGNTSNNSAIELLFEYIRQSHYPEVTSRFQSFFACETLREAKKFRGEFGKNTDKIFEVFTDNNYFKGNMSLLQNDQTSLICSYLGHEYWRGNTVPELEEFWEILLDLPVTIGLEVNDI